MKKFYIYTALAFLVIAITGYGVMQTSKTKNSESQKNESIFIQETSPQKDSGEIPGENVSQVNVSLDKSTINWSAKKTLVTTNNHLGTIVLEKGFVYMEDGIITGGEFIFDMESITNSDLTGALKNQLETHLKSEDFFAVASFPTSQFAMNKLSPLGESKFLVTGDLTIKGITNEITFTATILTVEQGLSLEANLEIDRTLWDIRFGSGKFFQDLGDNLIDDNIGLALEILVPTE